MQAFLKTVLILLILEKSDATKTKRL